MLKKIKCFFLGHSWVRHLHPYKAEMIMRCFRCGVKHKIREIDRIENSATTWQEFVAVRQKAGDDYSKKWGF